MILWKICTFWQNRVHFQWRIEQKPFLWKKGQNEVWMNVFLHNFWRPRRVQHHMGRNSYRCSSQVASGLQSVCEGHPRHRWTNLIYILCHFIDVKSISLPFQPCQKHIECNEELEYHVSKPCVQGWRDWSDIQPPLNQLVGRPLPWSSTSLGSWPLEQSSLLSWWQLSLRSLL